MAEKNQVKIGAIGGQAVMEGVMMQGPGKWALAVRTPEGRIETELHDAKPRPWARIPLVRGVLSFVSSMGTGYKTLMRSAEIAMGDAFEEEEPSRFDAWIERRFGDKAAKILMYISVVLGAALALGLFIVLPTFVAGLLGRFVDLAGWRSLVEGLMKMAIFFCYLALVRNMNEIKRMFRYHGAEHKTIACYEAGKQLTVDNVRPQTRYHARCSTSFILIVLVISILVNSLIPASGSLVRVGLKLLLLPVVMGISFEILRFTGRHDNAFTRILATPGKWVQRLTTAEPDDDMMECAIVAALQVLPDYQLSEAEQAILTPPEAEEPPAAEAEEPLEALPLGQPAEEGAV